MTLEQAIENYKADHEYQCKGFDPIEDGVYDGEPLQIANWLEELVELREWKKEKEKVLFDCKIQFAHYLKENAELQKRNTDFVEEIKDRREELKELKEENETQSLQISEYEKYMSKLEQEISDLTVKEDTITEWNNWLRSIPGEREMKGDV